MVFNDFIKDDFIPEAYAQVVSGSVSLPDPVVVEKEEQMLEREQNDRDVLSLCETFVSGGFFTLFHCSIPHARNPGQIITPENL